MTVNVKPVEVLSLKDACVNRLEKLILSGDMRIGERLPSERSLADMLHVSRPIVHEALVEIAQKGLVSIAPRKGVYVNDYRQNGSCALLSSLLEYHEGELEQDLRKSLIDMRFLLETETARMAARNRQQDHLDLLQKLISQEQICPPHDVEERVALDFAFHHTIAMASDNHVYPLVINSFKPVYTNLTRYFFNNNSDDIIGEVIVFHQQLIRSIQEQDEQQAVSVMAAMLDHGKRYSQPQRSTRNE